MNESSLRGISCEGLTEAFADDEARKARLILEARLCREQQEREIAAAKFAEAATIEEQLAETCANAGLREKSHVHAFSAASCWAQAGDFYEAIAICDQLLAEPTLPSRLRDRIESYANTLRARRAQWYGELIHAGQLQD
jgi:hypothetical protein